MDYLSRLDQTEARYDDLSRQMADPEVINDSERYRKTAKIHRDIEELVSKYREWKRVKQDLDGARPMIEEADEDLRAMATEEIARLEPELAAIEQDLKVLLLPKDPNDEKNVVLEIRAGTGGDEATLFAAEVFRMYTRYAESQRWKVEISSVSESAVGGLKEVIALISGEKVYSKLKYESGVHRVQRVPVTEQQGRVHTSAITVAVLPEADEVEIQVDAKDIRIDTFCSSGPGGQSVNTTYSAVRYDAHSNWLWWSPARTRNRRSRIARKGCGCSALASTSWSLKSSVPRSEPSAVAWSAAATAARRSVLTISRRTG